MAMVGIDEAGRGCWAGPLVAAAVILQKPIPGLRDSKLTTVIMRQTLASQIHTTAHVGIGVVESVYIDQRGLTAATTLAMQQALDAVELAAGQIAEEIIIDGKYNYLPATANVRTVVGADATIPAVGAASIVAKTHRDELMRHLALDYPGYGFDRHVGYGTRYHRQKLQELGVTAIHRRSYKPVKAILGEDI